MALFIIGSLPITNSVSAEDEVDNWPENDAWLHIELISWSANETVEWDNNGELPDPIFKICIEADGDNLDCINTPTWENQMTLNNSWNYSLDIPDHSNILNITIECEDNDALNDDECDMNSELDEWKLYAEYNWSATPTLTVSGNGDGDGNDTWKNAASTWKFTIDGFGDEDGDGVSDNLDQCPSSEQGLELLTQTEYIGCNWNQLDLDGDGVVSIFEQDPFDARIRTLQGGGRIFDSGINTYSSCRVHEGSNSIPFGEMFHVTENGILTTWINETRNYDWADYCPTDSGMDTWGSPFRADQILSFDFTKNETFKITDFKVNHALENTQHYTQNCQEQSANGVMQQSVKHIGDGKYIAHCYTAMDSTKQSGRCPTQSSIFLFNESEINRIMDIDVMWPSDCTNNENAGKINTLKSHLGAFGDFNADGVIDFVQGKNGECEIYYGLESTNFSFFGPQTISQSGCSTNLIAIDLDLDGYDDISSFSQTIFSEDGSFEFIPHSGTDWAGMRFSRGYADVYHLNHYDIDSDGDQDLLRIGCTNSESMNRDWCEVNLIENLWMLDDDSDNIANSEDYCPDTELDSIVDENGCSSSQKDTDNDGIMDDLDLCSDTLPVILGYAIDSNGCAEYQKDDDNDGINNSLDECPNTPDGDLINIRGCSFEDSQDLDSDGDGVLDSVDACLNTPADATVDSVGCDSEGNQTPDIDSDGDGVYDSLDDCANTPLGATVDFTGCPMDSDFDGVYDGIDECPSSNNPSPSDMDKSSEVDSTGCFIDSAGSETNSGSAASGCLGMIVMIGLVVFVVRKVRSPKQEQVFYAQTQPVISPVHRQSVPIPQVSSVPTPQVSSRERQLEHQSRQAQIEAQRLRQELANQAQFTQQLQSEAAQKQMSDAALAQKQHELAIAQREKEELEAKLAEAEKKAPVIQNFYVQDSVISGDLASTKNINQIQSDKPSFKDGNTGIEVSGISEEAAEMALFRSMQDNSEDTD